MPAMALPRLAQVARPLRSTSRCKLRPIRAITDGLPTTPDPRAGPACPPLPRDRGALTKVSRPHPQTNVSEMAVPIELPPLRWTCEGGISSLTPHLSQEQIKGMLSPDINLSMHLGAARHPSRGHEERDYHSSYRRDSRSPSSRRSRDYSPQRARHHREADGPLKRFRSISPHDRRYVEARPIPRESRPPRQDYSPYAHRRSPSPPRHRHSPRRGMEKRGSPLRHASGGFRNPSLPERLGNWHERSSADPRYSSHRR